MIKQAQGQEQIGGVNCNISFDIDSSITTVSVNVNTGTEEVPEWNTLQVIKQGEKVNTNFHGVAGMDSKIVAIETAIRSWLGKEEVAICTNLKSVKG